MVARLGEVGRPTRPQLRGGEVIRMEMKPVWTAAVGPTRSHQRPDGSLKQELAPMCLLQVLAQCDSLKFNHSIMEKEREALD